MFKHLRLCYFHIISQNEKCLKSLILSLIYRFCKIDQNSFLNKIKLLKTIHYFLPCVFLFGMYSTDVEKMFAPTFSLVLVVNMFNSKLNCKSRKCRKILNKPWQSKFPSEKSYLPKFMKTACAK